MAKRLKVKRATPSIEFDTIDVKRLKEHPRNYREHPEDQLEHIKASIRENGFYRNIVTARDYTILAGHGVAKAAMELGIKTVPICRLGMAADDPRALKVLTGDNEIEHLADQNDRLLSELLREIKDTDLDSGLLGTGFDEAMLANLALVSRPREEIASFNEAAEWVGMPEYGEEEIPIKLVVSFRNEEDKASFFEKLEVEPARNSKGATASMWWPPRDADDLSSIQFATDEDEDSGEV